METVIERIGGRNKVVVKHNHQAFILQCTEADVEYFKHCFDVMIDCFRKECEGKKESTELSNCNKPQVSRSTSEKRIAKLLLEALEILDKGSMLGIDWESTGKYYTRAYNIMQKEGYCT